MQGYSVLLRMLVVAVFILFACVRRLPSLDDQNQRIAEPVNETFYAIASKTGWRFFSIRGPRNLLVAVE
jgi:hypothetical protein